MTLLSNALRRAVRWGSNAVGIACLMITTAAGAGETWDTFASGARVDGPVQAVTTFGGDLIVGGQFGTAGPVPDTIGIARWDGANWSALGNGTQNSVLALTTFNGELIAGGLFASASGVPGTSYVAKWNGSTWSPLGTGMNGAVYSLTTFDDDGGGPHATALYAGGSFTKAGGTMVKRIAKWNGSAWSKLGTGVGGNSIVFALTSFNGDLIAGGQFAMAGGIAGTPGIARWNGAWAAVRSGMRPTQTGDSSPRAVFALAPSFAGDLLYAGGFCQVESVPLAPGYLMGYHFVP